MPTVQIPSQDKVRVTVNTAHVTHTVLDERQPSQAKLAVSMAGGFTLEGRVGNSVTLDELRAAESDILRLINTPPAR